MLTGWNGVDPVNRATLEKAKAALRRFDFIYLTEQMDPKSEQMKAYSRLLPPISYALQVRAVSGKAELRSILHEKLMPDEVVMMIMPLP